MAKRAGGSRASRARAGRAARAAGERPASQIARDDVLAGEAANEIAANAPPGEPDAIAEVIEGHIVAPDDEPRPGERARHPEDVAVDLAIAVRALRRIITLADETELPFVRAIGRIVYVLTVDGDREWCTATPIAVALLLFLPEQLDTEHRQSGTNRNAIDVTESNLEGLLYDRLNRLTSPEWGMAHKGPTGRGYLLTEDGRFVFNGWPEGIDFDPRNEDLWSKKRSSIRGGGRATARQARR